jgi:hypothetical protein
MHIHILIGSLFGPAIFGYRDTPHYAVIVWAILCSLYFLFKSRDVLAHSHETAYGEGATQTSGSLFSTFLIFVAISTVMTGVHYGVYFVAATFS